MLTFVRLAHHSTAISVRDTAGCTRSLAGAESAAMMRRGGVCWRSSMVELGLCKSQVAGSSPVASSTPVYGVFTMCWLVLSNTSPGCLRMPLSITGDAYGEGGSSPPVAYADNSEQPFYIWV